MSDSDLQSSPGGRLTTAEIAARLRRLPNQGMSRRVVVIMAIAFFFDLGDTAAIGFVVPALRESFGFSLGEISILISTTYAGLLIGAAIGGRLADRFGRLPVFTWGLVIASVGSLVHTVLSNLPAFIVVRLASTIGMGALFVITVTYLVEMSPENKRASRTAIAYFVGMLGAAAVATVARFTVPLGDNGWRWVFAVGGLGLLLVPLIRTLPESPLWLASRGRWQEAEESLMRLEDATGRGRELPPVEPMVDAPEEEKIATDGKWADVFRNPLLQTTLLLMVVWIVYTAITQTFNSWMPLILQERGFSETAYLTVAAVAIYGAPLGSLLAFFVGDRISRRTMMVLIPLITAVCAALFSFSPIVALVTTMAFGHFLLVAWYAPLLNTTMAESFPSNLRSTGSGVAFGAGRLSSVLVPFALAAALAQFGPPAIGWFLTVAWLILAAAALLLFGARRRNQPEAEADPLVTDEKTGEKVAHESG